MSSSYKSLNHDYYKNLTPEKYFGFNVYNNNYNYNNNNNYNWSGDAPTQTTSSGSSMQHVYYGPSSYNVSTRCIG